MFVRQVIWLVLLCCMMAALATPDGGESPPLPGPGLSYGGIPYGSMSGNVAEFYRQQAAPSGRSAYRSQFTNTAGIDFAPIEQWLR
ncbi:uncharacterized protein LOC133519581 [Cydia pomonella]|uniref:uncharacterized protein LOC133519581 n=1 Tax=Cydia pomonella TaxID=82600 RepID=UPI002ADE0654|nr:uncharacterized protein LOC133519581 [Cydia pomonella]